MSVQLKKCNVCKRSKTLDKFSPVVKGKYGVAAKCKCCVNLIAKEKYKENPLHRKQIIEKSYKKHPNSRKSNLLKYEYGISWGEYEAMRIKQDSKCAICGIPQETIGRILDVDHSHVTNKVRGLLCNPCNLSLGLVKDNIDTLKNMIKYLELSV